MEVIWLVQNTKESWVSMIGTGPVPREEQTRGWRTQREKHSRERLNWNSERGWGDRHFVILSVRHTWGQRPMRQDLGGTLSKLVSAGRGVGLGIAGWWCCGKSRRQETLTLVSSQVLERRCMDEQAALQSSSWVCPCGMKGPCRISVTTSTVPPLTWVLWEQPDEWSKLAADSVVNGHTQECRSLPKTLAPVYTPSPSLILSGSLFVFPTHDTMNKCHLFVNDVPNLGPIALIGPTILSPQYSHSDPTSSQVIWCGCQFPLISVFLLSLVMVFLGS